MSEKRVFVTGSTGCIGSHAVGILLEEGCQVFGFNRKPPAKIPSGYEHFEGDLSDKESTMLNGIISELQLQFIKAPARQRALEDQVAESDAVRETFTNPKEGPSEIISDEEE